MNLNHRKIGSELCAGYSHLRIVSCKHCNELHKVWGNLVTRLSDAQLFKEDHAS
jgi:hypothetical protein